MRILEVWREVMTGIAAIWFQLLFVKVAQWFLITYSEVKLNLGSGASDAAKKTLGGSFYDGLDPIPTCHCDDCGFTLVFILRFLKAQKFWNAG